MYYTLYIIDFQLIGMKAEPARAQFPRLEMLDHWHA